MKKVLMGLTVLAFAVSVNAAPTVTDIASPEFAKAFVAGAVPEAINPLNHKPHPSCEKVNLTPEQKSAIKEAFYIFAKEMTDIEGSLKKGIIDYAYALSTQSTTRDQGRESATAVTTAMTSLSATGTEFGLKIFFDILTPEQKEPAFECAMAKMKEHAKKVLERICKGEN
ncbi:MAG: hypothetical protein AB7H97_14230 [Pseudobdellovibrionaceae bacterium]